MFEQVPFTRLKYHADFTALAKRMGFPFRNYTAYGINPLKKKDKEAKETCKEEAAPMDPVRCDVFLVVKKL